MEIIVRGSKKPLQGMSKDEMHQRRKKLDAELRPTLFSKDQMNQRDCKTKDAEEKRVRDYMKQQVVNEPKMKEWSEINREFKRRGEEGRLHTPDDLRNRKSTKYD